MVGEVHRRSAATSSHTYLLGKLRLSLSDGGVCFVSQRSSVTANQRRKKLVFVLSPLVYSWWSRDSLVMFPMWELISWCSFWVLLRVSCSWFLELISVMEVGDLYGTLISRMNLRAEVEIGAPWPLPPLEATATLAHKFELLGTCKIKITSEKTTVKTSGNLAQIPPFDIPRLSDKHRLCICLLTASDVDGALNFENLKEDQSVLEKLLDILHLSLGSSNIYNICNFMDLQTVQRMAQVES
ncbi:hypothetical protein Bca52824_033945 [Brassica carinata]|uniref:Uncharacterized protein n=1 Tax=Brassica carinata TaxID=52824 RepID=A0A8X7V7J0_BRACI|nr:hypothetical protein Bca52824_033945 [Brassica carinata]